MKTIYFIRHGQTQWNKLLKLQGQKNSKLTQEGRDQAQNLSSQLQSLSIELLISSPLGRALETSAILLPKIEIIKNPLLSEMHFGTAEGLDKEVFKEQYPEEVQNLWTNAPQYDPRAYNGETFISLQKRAQNFLDALATTKESTIAVVAHGLILKMIFLLINNESLENFWETPVPQNTSITTVSYSAECYTIEEFSNTAHLTDTKTISYL